MMPDMSLPKHAQPEPPPPEPAGKSGTLAAWLVLIGMGGTSVAFNVWHATHAGGVVWPLALLYGLAPVLAAMGLAHMVATHRGGWLMRCVTVGVMGGAMALSAGAIASVVAPMAMHLSWLYGGVLDAASLVAVGVILTEHEREAARQAAREAAEKAEQKAAADGAERAAQNAIAEAAARAAEMPAAEPVQEPQPVPRRASRSASHDPDAEKARAAYRKSKRTGDAISDRALGEMFGRSRTWGANRIREVDDGAVKLAQAQ
jgi:hypothetical protein